MRPPVLPSCAAPENWGAAALETAADRPAGSGFQRTAHLVGAGVAIVDIERKRFLEHCIDGDRDVRTYFMCRAQRVRRVLNSCRGAIEC